MNKQEIHNQWRVTKKEKINPYLEACLEASRSDKAFSVFKNNPRIKTIIGQPDSTVAEFLVCS